MKTAIVTGGAGFIGSHLVDALVKKGHRVIVIDDLSTGFKRNINPKATFKKLDIREKAATEIIRKTKPDVIFHLAAQISAPISLRDPVRDADINILGAIKLMQAAVEAKVGKFVLVSSGGLLSSEKTKVPTDEKNIIEPPIPYSISKLAVEDYARHFSELKGLPVAVIRPANVYGPRQNPHGESGVVAIFIGRMLGGEPIRIDGNGSQTADHIYVGDVVDALLAAASNKKSKGPYHVGTGVETSVMGLFESLARMTGYWERPVRGPARAGEPKRRALDSSKIRRELGWKPKTKLEDGLLRTVTWFKKHA